MKAILIIDMPGNCIECNQRDISHTGEHYCNITGDENDIYMTRGSTRPDWCPLRPLPEKKDVLECKGMYDVIAKRGWNACLDAIEGSTHE